MCESTVHSFLTWADTAVVEEDFSMVGCAFEPVFLLTRVSFRHQTSPFSVSAQEDPATASFPMVFLEASYPVAGVYLAVACLEA